MLDKVFLILQIIISDVISKVAFRTSVVESMLFDLFAKVKCQIIAEIDDPSAEDIGTMRRSQIWKATENSFTWSIIVDSSNAPRPPTDAPPSPTRSKRSTEEIIMSVKVTFKMGEDCSITVPITGEKVNVSIYKQNFL